MISGKRKTAKKIVVLAAVLLCLAVFQFLNRKTSKPRALSAARSVSIPAEKSWSCPFPYPKGLSTQVEFWKTIFTEYTTSQAVIHDDRYLDVVYEVMDLEGKYKSDRLAWKAVRARKKKYRKILENMEERWDSPHRMTQEEQRIRKLFEGIPGSEHYKKKDAKKRVRAQAGQSDRFRRGVARSGMYIDEMKRIFRRRGLPSNLAYLPMIESSFHTSAVSHVGATGMWQIMRGTGKRYGMEIGILVDERRDPIKSAGTAARILADNYRILESWPLAVTAYNYGPGGIRNAVKTLGTKDIVRIIEEYEARRFRFASRNFYAEFLATLELVLRDNYFAGVPLHEPPVMASVRLDENIAIRGIEIYCGVSESEIRELNPSLTSAVFQAGILPEKIELNIPSDREYDFIAGCKAMPSSYRYENLPFKMKHRVRRGQTLSSIARRYQTTPKAIARLNAIRNPKKIKPGQVLTIPEG